MDNNIAKKKFQAYKIPSVDEAKFNPSDTNSVNIDELINKPLPYENKDNLTYDSFKNRVPKKKLIRQTTKQCPKCEELLFNTRLDVKYFYCANCNKQYSNYL